MEQTPSVPVFVSKHWELLLLCGIQIFQEERKKNREGEIRVSNENAFL
jgi:hypothetical protein